MVHVCLVELSAQRQRHVQLMLHCYVRMAVVRRYCRIAVLQHRAHLISHFVARMAVAVAIRLIALRARYARILSIRCCVPMADVLPLLTAVRPPFN
jgi:hypothetical protein